MPYSESDKLQQEVEKLKLEIATLKRPFRSQPGMWFAAAALLISITANVGQFLNSQREFQLGEIRHQRTLLSIEQAEKARLDLEVKLNEAKAGYEQAMKKTMLQEERTRQLLADARAAETKLRTSPNADSQRVSLENTISIAELRQMLQPPPSIRPANQRAGRTSGLDAIIRELDRYADTRGHNLSQ